MLYINKWNHSMVYCQDTIPATYEQSNLFQACHNVKGTFTYLMNNIMPFYCAVTQCHSQGDSTPGSHSRGSRFKSHLGYRHPPSPSTLNPGMVLQNTQQPLSSKFCMVHHSLMTYHWVVHSLSCLVVVLVVPVVLLFLWWGETMSWNCWI